MPPRLFWQAPADPEGSEIQTLTFGRPPTRQAAAAVSGDDIVYPPPGGGLLRVPVGGGVAENFVGEERGQLIFWSETEQRWIRTLGEPQEGNVPIFNETSGLWEYGPQASIGQLEYFGLAHSPVALYRFNESLNDFSGNGHNLALAAGNLAFCDVVPGKKGLMCLIGARYQNAAAAPGLQLTGDMTILAIAQQDATPISNPNTVVTYNGPTETEADNTLYQLNFDPTGAYTTTRNLGCISEHGAGVNDIATSGGGTDSLPPIHNLLFVAWRRQSNTVRFYANGRPLGPDTALTAPTGGNGANTRLVVGASSTGATVQDVMVIFSLKIVPSALTDAEVLAEYNRTVGPAFGILT